MDAKDLLSTGNLAEALAKTQEDVRRTPDRTEERILLFQLYCLNGDWIKAKKQLPVIKSMRPESLPMVETYSRLIDMESLRLDVFAGRRTPLLFGQPEAWLSYLLQALKFDGENNVEAADELRDKAFDEAEAISGQINSTKFEWLADSDPRLGPVLELMMSNAYYWIPFSAIKTIRIQEPTDLRDQVWTAANLQWINGGPAVGFIPTRYVSTLKQEDPRLKLSSLTSWIGDEPVGQRTFVHPNGEVSLMDVRNITFDTNMDVHKELGPISHEERMND